MNDTIKTILSRQTIREYTSQQVPDELLDVIIQSAIRSPSARNTQPCHLRITKNAELLDEMNTDFKNLVGWDTPAYTGYDVRPVYHNAPVFIFIFAENPDGMSAGLMAENIALASHSLGLGSCMIGSLGALFEDSEMGKKWKNILDIPEDWHFLLGISLGYPNEKPPFKAREDGHVKFIG